MDSVTFARHLRKNQTDAESLFWSEVRNRRFKNLKFRRQVPIDRFTVDFLCESEKLIVEIDDSRHEDRKIYDNNRTEILNKNGYRVIRFTNADIYEDIVAVLDRLFDFVGQD